MIFMLKNSVNKQVPSAYDNFLIYERIKKFKHFVLDRFEVVCMPLLW